MERLNSEIYEKYKNLKKRRFLDEEWSRKRDSDIRNYQSAAEDLIEELKNENDRLRAEMSSMQEQYAECKKLLLDESQKTNELSNEVGRLQNLLSQKNDVNGIALLRSPDTIPRDRSREKSRTPPKKKTPNSSTKESGIQHKEAAIVPYGSRQEEQFVPDCCRRELSSSGDAGGKGYTFDLTWIRHEGREGELLYHVSSLGTLERVALDWMKEDMIFSMTMCPIFFERISRVIGRH